MSKRIIIVIVISLVLVILAGFVLYISITGEPENKGDIGIEEKPRRGFFSFLSDQDRETENIDETSTGKGVDQQSGDQIVTTDSGLPILRTLWNKPVSGIVFAKGDDGQTTIRFIERGTGHVYETYPTSTKTTRITNSTIPKIQEVLWTSPDQLVIRYLRDESDAIETFAANIVKSTATSSENGISGDLRGQFLPIDIIHLALREDGELFYLTEISGGVRGVVSNFDGSGAKQVFSSPVRDWLAEWVNQNTVALTTKASNSVFGHLVFLNTTTGSLTPKLGDVPGLTTNVISNAILYSTHQGDLTTLISYDPITGTRVPVNTVGTIADKCTGSEKSSAVVFCAAPKNTIGNLLPDQWYQGAVSFDDDLWKVDLSAKTMERILDVDEFTADNLDIIDISVDSTESYIVFRNKRDGFPWLLALPQENPLATTSPEITQ